VGRGGGEIPESKGKMDYLCNLGVVWETPRKGRLAGVGEEDLGGREGVLSGGGSQILGVLSGCKEGEKRKFKWTKKKRGK